MQAKPLLAHILRDDALTRGLGDPEAKVLVEWLVEQVEALAARERCEERANDLVRRLCRRGRAISRFVRLWCHDFQPGAAYQLAAVERFTWPLPTAFGDSCELMQEIVTHESRRLRVA